MESRKGLFSREVQITFASLRSFLKEESGQTLTEYIALVIGGLIVLGALVFLFGVVRDLFYSTGQQLRGIGP